MPFNNKLFVLYQKEFLSTQSFLFPFFHSLLDSSSLHRFGSFIIRLVFFEDQSDNFYFAWTFEKLMRMDFKKAAYFEDFKSMVLSTVDSPMEGVN